MTEDFHDYAWKFGRFRDRLARESFSKQDQDLIIRLIEHSRAQVVSEGRAYMLAWSLLGITRLLYCDLIAIHSLSLARHKP